MDNMISNMQYLGDDANPNILLLPSFYHSHHESHFEFECPCCQDAISRVLSDVVKPWSLTQASEQEVNNATIQ